MSTPASSTLPTPSAVPRTGCDLQPVDVVRDAVRHFGARYLDRVYTPAEQASYAAGGPASLAARFAAKEAVLKLIGTADGVDLRSVEIRTPAVGGGRPAVHLTGRAAELAEEAGVDAAGIDVSLSHTADLAMAVAIGLQRPTTQTTNETATMNETGTA
ncbi:holo-ACP synthase [Nocardioides sp.]|uniref:holo-ACP synthase n=1 Tax=Nocardioides sp. TaxID=35761 RepID=UPI001A24B8E6|nr:holo-ACP synthase [Nocardioides sp.]MBJ7356462.1 holo-ACP synthase [Nocardioides sp.]